MGNMVHKFNKINLQFLVYASFKATVAIFLIYIKSSGDSDNVHSGHPVVWEVVM
jgi:hypothetical protein